MKNCYFSEHNIDKKALEILEKVKKYHAKHNIDINFKNSALLILDMQKYFLESKSHAFIPSAISIINKICKLKKEYHNNKLPVILTRHINTEQNAKLMKTWWKYLITEDNPNSEIISELKHSSNIIINKTQYDGFYQTDLEKILEKHSITHLIITGVMTHLCVETTARSAFTHGYNVFLPVDGTATYDETFHYSTIYNLSHGFAIPTLIDYILEQIKDI